MGLVSKRAHVSLLSLTLLLQGSATGIVFVTSQRFVVLDFPTVFVTSQL